MAVDSTIIIGIIVVVLLAIVITVVTIYPSNQQPAQIIGSGGAGSGGTRTASTLYTVSDAPAMMINGQAVSAVTITVTNISIHSATTGKWYSAPIATNGTYNLVALSNTSAFMSNAQLSSGAYDEIALTISNVTATVNGTTHGVFLPSGTLKVFGNFVLTNTTTNWVNIDFKVNQSLHSTGNGRLVLLPVIQTRLNQGAQVTVGGNGTVTVQNSGTVTAEVDSGMNVDGTMEDNFTIPMNENLTLGVNGTVGIGVGPGRTH